MKFDYKSYSNHLESENESLNATIDEIQQAKDKLQNDYQEARDKIDELQHENEILQTKIDILAGKKIIEYQKDEHARLVQIRTDRKRIQEAIELIRKAMVESDITGNGTLNLNKLLEILGDKENE